MYKITIFLLLSFSLNAHSSDTTVSYLPTSYSKILKEASNYKNTVIFLWTPYCSPCIKEIKSLRALIQ